MCWSGWHQLALAEWHPYVANMQVDGKRFTKDCAKAQAGLIASGGGHCGTGATAIIEPVLPLIRDLRRQKHSWSAIATALARQGVVQGVDRRPITARRLTALIAAIDKRERRRRERLATRSRRTDLAPPPAAACRTLALSDDLAQERTAISSPIDHEEVIRRQEFEERVRSLMKREDK